MARLSPVKCPYCGQSFYREDTEFVQLGRRYAHKECYNISEQIHTLMQHILGMTYSKTKIESQIKNFITKEGIPITGILNSLIYWYEIKKMPADQANGGIGIVPYIYAQYLEYQLQKQNNAKINKNKKLTDYVNNKPIEIIGKATPIRKPRHIKFYELS